MAAISRRTAMTSAAASAAAGLVPGRLAAETAPAKKRSRLVILGTKGGPRVTLGRAMTGHLLLTDGVPYVVDCGYGTVGQIVRAGVALSRLPRWPSPGSSCRTSASG
jgi:hypothetical protein